MYLILLLFYEERIMLIFEVSKLLHNLHHPGRFCGLFVNAVVLQEGANFPKVSRLVNEDQRPIIVAKGRD